MKTRFLAALCVACPVIGIAGEQRFVEKYIATYPFLATPERAVEIMVDYTKIISGMTANQVESVLGVPDEVRPLYEPKIKNGKQVGHTYWYVLRRARESGSVKEKDESVVRISFDSSGLVSRVDHW